MEAARKVNHAVIREGLKINVHILDNWILYARNLSRHEMTEDIY
jgi:hypothetical protein